MQIQNMGERGIILWALFTVFFLVLCWNIFIFRYLRLLGISNLTISTLWSNYKSPLRTILNIFIVLLEILQDLRYTLFLYEKLLSKVIKDRMVYSITFNPQHWGIKYFYCITQTKPQTMYISNLYIPSQ